MERTEAGTERRAREAVRPYPAALRVVHVCAAVVVLASALAGRVPFLWVADTVARRPEWSGLVLMWLVGTVSYLLLWRFAMLGHRVAEIGLVVLFVLGALWAGLIVLISVLQAVGVSIGDGVFGMSWTLRLVVAVATLVGALALLRWQGDDKQSGERRHLAMGAKGAAATVATAIVGLLVAAYMLALLDPPRATPQQAAAEVHRSLQGTVQTGDVVRFQQSLGDRVSELAHDRTRDGWDELNGVFKATHYDNTVQWGQQLVFRDQLVCVARRVQTGALVVMPGYCPG